MSIHSLLVKYKKAYYMSFDFIITYNLTIVDEMYILHLMYKTITGNAFQHNVVQIPFTSDLENKIATLVLKAYNEYKNHSVLLDYVKETKTMQGILKCKPSLKKKTVHFALPIIREEI